MVETIGQLALISSVLGGFSFTFLSTLIISKTGKNKIEFWVLLFLVIASMSFLLSALGWSVINFDVESSEVMRHHQFLVKLFLLALFSIIIAIGFSGWIRDRAMGLVTSVVAVLTIIVLVSEILSRYLTV